MVTNGIAFDGIGSNCGRCKLADEGRCDARCVACDLSHDAGGWLEDLLSRGRAKGRTDRRAAARLPQFVPHVPRTDPTPERQIPCGGAGLSGLRLQRRASPEQYAYTFDHLADTVDHFLDQKGVTKYSIYIQDYGSPVGFRLATRHPERVQAIITQNGNAYEEGLSPFWAEFLYAYWKDPNPTNEAKVRQLLTLDATKLQYLQGFRHPDDVSPDSYLFDQAKLDRPGNDKIQLALFYDYRNNPPLYPAWHKYLRDKKPVVLVVWGKNDPVFAPAGAEAFLRDVPNAELRLLDTGHFALEEDGAEIAQIIRAFLAKNIRVE